MSISAEKRDDRLVVTMPAEALEAAEAVSLLETFARLGVEQRSTFLQSLMEGGWDAGREKLDPMVGLSPEQRRYIGLLIKGLRERDPGAEEFTDADLYALTEAQRLRLPLTARQRLTLIQYYVDRERFSPPPPLRGGGTGSQAMNRMAALARTLRKKA